MARLPKGVKFKLFIVDNKSRKQELLRIKECFDYLTSKNLLDGELIESDSNLGFSGGNNLGIASALKDPSFTNLCLLNNDTVVTPFWLERLLNHNPGGLLGPVSNSVGNEQVVPVTYYGNTPDGYLREKVWNFSSGWFEDHENQKVPTEMLGFFCVFGTRATFEKIGMLDEQFGAGTFEDDDYCARAKKLDLPLEIARDVFVHHWGSASFSKMGNKKLYRLMKRNRLLFEKKHGVDWKSPISTLPIAYQAEIENNLRQKYGNRDRRQAAIEAYLKLIRRQIEWHFRPFDPLNPVRTRIALGLLIQMNPLIQYLLLRLILIPKYFWMYSRKPAFRTHIQFKLKNAISLSNRFLKKKIGKLKQVLFPGKKNLICFPICPHAGRRQRPQQLIEGISRQFDRTFWIEPQSVTFNGIIENSFKISQVFLKGQIQNFYIDQVPSDSIKELDISLLEILVPRKGEIVIVVQSLYWLGHIQQLKKIANRKQAKIKIVYDCMDHHGGFGSVLFHNDLHEQNIIHSADYLIASSDTIEDFLKPFNKPLCQIKNACSVENFPFLPEPTKMSKIGYFGAIAEWFDWELVKGAAELMPEVSFELIGDFSTIEKFVSDHPQNISFLGEKPFKILKDYARDWQVALIPFRITPLIQATNPVKLYEYSALGLPVISTPIPEVISSKTDAKIVNNAFEFKQAYEAIISTELPEKRNLRRLFACQNTWDVRSLEFQKLLNES